MKRRERFPHDDPREWLNRARSNLAHARNRTAEVYLEELCFNAQQAAEKAIKALMIARGIEFPYVHDLGHLLSLLEDQGEVIPSTIRRASELTKYATATRYPGAVRPVTETEHVEAVELAEAVVRWAEGEV